jgi:hypothetical protein
MQRTLQPTRTSTAPTQDAHRAAGPRPIDPADFKFIGGGAPRGGWVDPTTTTVAASDTVSAPRGGW